LPWHLPGFAIILIPETVATIESDWRSSMVKRRIHSTGPARISDRLFLVGSSDITDSRDCSVYLLDLGELVLIDAGAGPSASKIARNVEIMGFNPSRISSLILTHCHIDHIGGASFFRDRFKTQLVMHEIDARPVERGDARMTAAFWYNLPFPPLPIDVKLSSAEESLNFKEGTLICLHTPGHTPGSLSVYIDLPEGRILFGQDIHGPFHPDFGSDLSEWSKSMKKLMFLEADILCEGHFGVYRPKESVKTYIRHYLESYDEEP
jgi:glyoxylase-like metal-dependent hydrolase (beta-lactamase superfamily II)